MATALGDLLPGAFALLMAIAVASAASGEASSSSVVVGLAKCADCTRKNMKAEAAFKGVEVVIKCKNSEGDYESKATGKLDGSGAFSIPLSTDLHAGDCVAQLHSAAGTPCPGQEPSRIVPQSSEGNFVVVPAKTDYPSAECASATLDHFDKKHLWDHFHKKPVPPKPKPEPKPEPEYHHPTPTYASPTPIYHPPARQLYDKKPLLDHFHKDHDYQHFLDHFHKKPVPPKPKPEPKPQPTPTYTSPTPIYHPPVGHSFDKKTLLDHFHKDHDYHHYLDHFHKKPVPPKPKPEPKPQPTPTYSSPTPIYHPPAGHSFDKKPLLDHFHKDHDYQHFWDHFHKKPVPPKPKPEPKPEPEYHPPTPTYGSPTPIYHPPTRHLLNYFHKDHDYHHFFDHFHKKPVPPKPKPEPEPKPLPKPTYGSPTPIYHPPSLDKKHFLDHFHKGHDYHHFFDHFHKKPVPPKPKPEPKPQPEPEYHPPTPTYTSPTPIYHPPAKH